jgi:hypothetical protein
VAKRDLDFGVDRDKGEKNDLKEFLISLEKEEEGLDSVVDIS